MAKDNYPWNCQNLCTLAQLASAIIIRSQNDSDIFEKESSDTSILHLTK